MFHDPTHKKEMENLKMENKNIKINKKRGRPKYNENIEQLKQLLKQVKDKKITNEERLEVSKMSVRQNGFS